MVILKICLSEDSFGNIQKENKISAVNETAAIIKQFCGAHNIPGHFDENTFVCMFQTTADAPAITDALSSLLLQCEVYIRSYGVDSFVCSAVQCLGKSFDDVFGQCIEEVYASETMLKERRKIYRYRQLLELRNRIYLSPLKTSDSAEIPSVFADKPDSFRHSYKKCFGISFHKDRINARIAKAKHLLITTSMNINKIAEMCGYLDTKHFMHQFSQLTSTTPTGYRKLFSE